MRVIWAGLVFALANPVGAFAADTTLTVGGAGADYATIQQAVDHAPDGATIVVRSGTYREHVAIAKPLVLEADGHVSVDAGKTGSAVTLAGSGIRFTGFELRNAGSSGTEAGLFVTGDDNVVSEVRATGNNWGIVVSGEHGNTVSDSEASSNRHDGIALLGAVSTTVARNVLADNGRAGVWIESGHVDDTVREASENKVLDNDAHGNRNFGIALNSGAVRNEVTGNEVMRNGRAISDAGIVLNCGPNGNLVSENEVSGNQKHGILLISAAFANRVLKNAVTGSETGIGVYDANANEIAWNGVTGGAEYGIRLDDMSPVMGAAAANPAVAAAFPVSSQNVLHHNDLTANRVNAFDRSGTPWMPPGADKMPPALLQGMGQMLAPNRWDDGREGNHYDDFDERAEGFADEDGNGIGDKPRAIPGGTAVDNFPLAQAPMGR